jgi:hypothetical protein
MADRQMLSKALASGAVAAALLAAACGSANNGKTNQTAANSGQVAPAATIQILATTPQAATPARAATPAVNPVERVNGMVQSVAGNSVMLSGGGSFTLAPQTVISKRVAGSASTLQPGRVVAVTATRQADNTLLASLITVFPTVPNGFPLGQSPLAGGDLMTNATIDKVNGNSFSVTFPGGGAQVTLAPNAQITMLATGSAADIVAGASVVASVRDGVAQNVSIAAPAASPTPQAGY